MSGPVPEKRDPSRSKASLQPASRLIMSWESQQVLIVLGIQKNQKAKTLGTIGYHIIYIIIMIIYRHVRHIIV